MKAGLKYIVPACIGVAAIGAVALSQFTAHADPMDRYLATPEWASGDCERAWSDDRYLGRSQAQLAAALGEADVDHRFQLATGVNEFTVGLLNIYSAEDEPEREILQQTWSHGGCHLTVWSSESEGQMVSVDRLRYPDGVEF